MNANFCSDRVNLTMLTDFYEITMANGYFASGFKDTIGYFDMFFRKVPDGGGFAIMAGVEQLVDTPRGVTPGHKVHVALIASRIALGYAYPIRVHPRRVVLSVHADANATAINRRQERGYLVQ